ncbi:MAG: hypothetical protein ACI8TP_003573 [Acidimicrobiales bacterium]|jgi:hypothetical protein
MSASPSDHRHFLPLATDETDDNRTCRNCGATIAVDAESMDRLSDAVVLASPTL